MPISQKRMAQMLSNVHTKSITRLLSNFVNLINFCRSNGLFDQLVGQVVDPFLLMTRILHNSAISKTIALKVCRLAA